MAALARSRSTETIPNDIMLEYYMHASPCRLRHHVSTEWPNSPGIWNSAQAAGWKRIVDAVHKEGGRMYCQLFHTGRVSHPEAPHQIASGEPIWGPSAIRAAGGKFRFLPGVPGYQMPTEIPDPMKIVELFRIAALHAKDAGFDGVEMIHQFMDPSANQRTDKWGGSPENLVCEIWGPNVGLKINPGGGYNDMGFPLDETIASFGYLLAKVDKMGLAYVCILQYLDYFDTAKRGTAHDVWETYAPFLKNTPVIPNGGVTPEQALEWVESGKYPAVFIGIPWISHPDLTRRVKAGKPLDNPLDGPHTHGGNFEPSIGYLDYPEATYD
ncbi:unnamed protein product [Mycena citricolor]|uniref:NADH:flavin oxidoreductase/NADH oxidase N-terminal domain-containing protein n=1 Tax=Mycena citricolor TaxID=2018698 RepID=A0AAD2HHZ1_9AGAR|nr:unnamed protein product [Mycena citricolor]